MNQNSVNYNVVTLQKVELRNLAPYLANALIVGIIIGKNRPKLFEAQGAEVNSRRAVWNFTIRDSLQHYINVSYWGTSEQIIQANEKFVIGDVGKP